LTVAVEGTEASTEVYATNRDSLAQKTDCNFIHACDPKIIKLTGGYFAGPVKSEAHPIPMNVRNFPSFLVFCYLRNASTTSYTIRPRTEYVRDKNTASLLDLTENLRLAIP
jgi:hypothetical protein